MSFLKNHPFAVKAHFGQSVVLSYAIEKDSLKALVPSALDIDTFQDRYGFIAVAMVQTRSLRPAIFPQCLGRDFFLCGIRIFVRHTGKDGRKRRGLYILKSLTNKKSMVRLGNTFTHYNYDHCSIHWKIDHKQRISTSTGLHLTVCNADDNSPLPDGSPFKDWREARLFSGPMPFTFSHHSKKSTICTVEGVRESWKPQPLRVEHAHIPYLETLGFSNAQLANAFAVRDVNYYWKKGVTEPC